jgi:hypothetical protein
MPTGVEDLLDEEVLSGKHYFFFSDVVVVVERASDEAI